MSRVTAADMPMQPIDEALDRIISAWAAGFGALPDHLGLDEAGFSAILKWQFPKASTASFRQPGRAIDPERAWEAADLTTLLYAHRASRDPREVWVARIVATGCLGSNHLWQDLALTSRTQLSDLLQACFPGLVARNSRDMKWKKFLYRQLCQSEGIYICRSPSCEACVDYPVCFGPEE